MKRSALTRQTPLRAKRATPRTRKTSPCRVRGCRAASASVRVEADERYCRKHATAVADRACGAFVRARDPRCVACGSAGGVPWGQAHTRGMRYVRWDALNSVGLCARCHFAYTRSPARWVKFVERTWPGRWVRILHRELWAERHAGAVDVAEVIRAYREGRSWEMPDPPPGVFLEEV